MANHRQRAWHWTSLSWQEIKLKVLRPLLEADAVIQVKEAQISAGDPVLEADQVVANITIVHIFSSIFSKSRVFLQDSNPHSLISSKFSFLQGQTRLRDAFFTPRILCCINALQATIQPIPALPLPSLGSEH